MLSLRSRRRRKGHPNRELHLRGSRFTSRMCQFLFAFHSSPILSPWKTPETKPVVVSSCHFRCLRVHVSALGGELFYWNLSSIYPSSHIHLNLGCDRHLSCVLQSICRGWFSPCGCYLVPLLSRYCCDQTPCTKATGGHSTHLWTGKFFAAGVIPDNLRKLPLGATELHNVSIMYSHIVTLASGDACSAAIEFAAGGFSFLVDR
jgi:hypothetical protein